MNYPCKGAKGAHFLTCLCARLDCPIMGRVRLLGMGGGGELDVFPLAALPSAPATPSDCTRCMPGSGIGA